MVSVIKRLTFIIAFVCFSSSHGDTMTWCAYYKWAPWIYPTSDGYAGVMIDQLALFKAKYPSIQVENANIDNWKRCQSEVAQGKVTMILGANKTPERAEVLDYLSQPAFINFSTVETFTSNTNTKILAKPKMLQDLSSYKLAMIRGNSYGSEIDPFISQLNSKQLVAFGNQAQVLKMVKSNRFDYFFIPKGGLKRALDDAHHEFTDLKATDFNKILEVPRRTPVYFTFGKTTQYLQEFGAKWLTVLDDYHRNHRIENEIIRHQKQANKN